MNTCFDLYPQPLQIRPEGQYRSCLIKHITESGDVSEKILWYLYPHNINLPDDDDCDSYLLASLLPAMKLGVVINIHGKVSNKLLANLTELQLIWYRWCPNLYSLIDMNVDEISKEGVPVDGAIVAFSGGVDASFSAYRHVKLKAGYATQHLKAGVLVHGFDIPVNDIESFKGAAKLAYESLNDLNIELIMLKTNIRELFNINWNHFHGLALASVFNGLSNYVGTALIGSGDPYDKLTEPWGSHPMTDPLLSSDKLNILHDGAGFSRSSKISLLANWPTGVKNLRVCWAGKNNAENCGKCEKCVRTRLNFIVAGLDNPECFKQPLEKKDLKSIVLTSFSTRIEWEQIRAELKSIDNPSAVLILNEVDKVLKRKPLTKLSFILPPNSKRREFVKNVLKKVK